MCYCAVDFSKPTATKFKAYRGLITCLTNEYILILLFIVNCFFFRDEKILFDVIATFNFGKLLRHSLL